MGKMLDLWGTVGIIIMTCMYFIILKPYIINAWGWLISYMISIQNSLIEYIFLKVQFPFSSYFVFVFSL